MLPSKSTTEYTESTEFPLFVFSVDSVFSVVRKYLAFTLLTLSVRIGSFLMFVFC